MKRNAHLFGSLTSLFLTVTFIIGIVVSIKGLSSLSSYSGSIIDFSKGIITFELIMSIVLLISCIITISIILKYGGNKTIYVSSSITFSSLALYSIVDTFLAFELLKKMIGNYAYLPGETIAKLVLLFVALLLALISLSLQKTLMHDDKANYLMIIACLCLMTCCIISFAAMSEGTDGTTISSTIFLTLGVVSGGYLFINSYAHYGTSQKTTTTSYSASKNYNEPSTSKNIDPVEQLKMLKELYDTGVITSEEYTEKRKKYIDEL